MSEIEHIVTATWKDGRLSHVLDCSPKPDGQHQLYDQSAIDHLLEKIDRLEMIESSWLQFMDKTSWVQAASEPHELGKHRADVLKDRIDRLTAELDAAIAERDSVRNAIGNDMLKSYIEKHGDHIPLVLELASYKVDASRWNELCRQVDLTMFPYAILDDAMAMGAGALEIYIDEAMKEQEQCK